MPDSHLRVLVVSFIAKRHGINKSNQLSASKNELIQGVLGGFGNILRMDDHEYVHASWDFRGSRFDAFDGKILLQALEENPSWLLWGIAIHHGHWVRGVRASPHVETTHNSHCLAVFLKLKDVLNGPRNVVL